MTRRSAKKSQNITADNRLYDEPLVLASKRFIVMRQSIEELVSLVFIIFHSSGYKQVTSD